MNPDTITVDGICRSIEIENVYRFIEDIDEGGWILLRRQLKNESLSNRSFIGPYRQVFMVLEFIRDGVI